MSIIKPDNLHKWVGLWKRILLNFLKKELSKFYELFSLNLHKLPYECDIE